MFSELSLNVLDIAQNSINANSTLIEISVHVFQNDDILKITIKDNGKGMDSHQIEKAIDPFFTTRNTRKVGLGLPFFKLSSELTNGNFSIISEKGKGTTVCATYILSHIDRAPLGDITETIYDLIVYNDSIDFIYTYAFNDKSFTLDTREFKMLLGDIPLSNPEVSCFVWDFLSENKKETDMGINI